MLQFHRVYTRAATGWYYICFLQRKLLDLLILVSEIEFVFTTIQQTSPWSRLPYLKLERINSIWIRAAKVDSAASKFIATYLLSKQRNRNCGRARERICKILVCWLTCLRRQNHINWAETIFRFNPEIFPNRGKPKSFDQNRMHGRLSNYMYVQSGCKRLAEEANVV